MSYVFGFLRRTALWAMLLTVLGSISMKDSKMLYMLAIFGAVYLFFVLIYLFKCKKENIYSSSGEAYLSVLGHDLAAPFSKIGTFVAVITKKWTIQDDSKLHNFVDGLQVVTGGIWAIVILGIAVYFIVNFIVNIV